MKILAAGCALLISLSACTDKTANTAKEPPLAPASADLEKLAGFAGTYVVVDVRRASDVAAPAMPGIASDSPIGQTLTFTQKDILMAGISCEDWRITPDPDARLNVTTDRNLKDLTLGPVDVSTSRGDQQDHSGFQIMCEGERFAALHKVDDRVLVMPRNNSQVNLILERPLTPLQIKSYQAQLKSMKFYAGELTGEMDAATLNGSRIYYNYRADLNDTDPLPARPAITENLLDALRVLQ